MFTGIIESVGRIAERESRGGELRLRVDVGELDVSDVKTGGSVAVSGVCLTVIEHTRKSLAFDVSRETLARTALSEIHAGDRVNLERALLPTTRLGGHLMAGHVDGVGAVVGRESSGNSLAFAIQAPPSLAKYIAEKGSIGVDGVSITVNSVRGARFDINVIPHTLAGTTFDELAIGRLVNLEVDILARYVERLMSGESAAPRRGAITAAFLAEHGFLPTRD